MADQLSDSDRLTLIEELLARLLTGQDGPRERWYDRDLYLQQTLKSMLKRLEQEGRSGEQSAFLFEKALPTSLVRKSDLSWMLDHLAALYRRIDTLTKQADEIQVRQLESLQVLSASDALANDSFRRVVPSSIYLGNVDVEAATRLQEALREAANEIGFEIVHEGPLEFGSIFQRLFAKTKEAMKSDEVQLRLQKLERALELKHLDSVQATTDLALSKAAKNISDILSKQDEGIVCLGSVYGIKVRHAPLIIIALSQEEMLAIAKDPSLKRSPDKLLEILTEQRSSTADWTDLSSNSEIGGRHTRSNPLAKDNQVPIKGKHRPKLPPPRPRDS
jgi:hypothetical protein